MSNAPPSIPPPFADHASDVIHLDDSLTAVTAPMMCRSVREGLAATVRPSLWIDALGVTQADAVGLAALLQCARLAEQRGVRFTVGATEFLRGKLVDAMLLDEIPVVTPHSAASTAPAAASAPTVLARSTRLALRTPTGADLPLFETWAHDPFLEQMVGSDVLYRCRHLGCDDPGFVASLLDDVTGLTVLVEVADGAAPVVGFAHLYGIRLVEGLAFLEVVIGNHRALRKGWGIEAARLLLAYAQDAMGIRRVEAKAYAYNHLSINALRRNGFHEEGVLRQARLCDAQYWDILVFSILDDEMRAQRRSDELRYMGFWSEA